MQTRNKYIFGDCPKLQINQNYIKNKIVIITDCWHEKQLYLQYTSVTNVLDVF